MKVGDRIIYPIPTRDNTHYGTVVTMDMDFISVRWDDITSPYLYPLRDAKQYFRVVSDSPLKREDFL